MEQPKEYYAFISYKREEEKWAKWLQDKLEHYHLPASFNRRTNIRYNLQKVLRERDEQTQKALVDTNNLIVVCSPHYLKSDAISKEVGTFIALGKEDQAIPFIVEGNNTKECFPKSLKRSKAREKSLKTEDVTLHLLK